VTALDLRDLAQVLGLETLETRGSDSADFHELAVWDVKKALELAFKMGEARGRRAGK